MGGAARWQTYLQPEANLKPNGGLPAKRKSPGRCSKACMLLQVATDAAAWAVQVRGSESAAGLASESSAGCETGTVRCAASGSREQANTDAGLHYRGSQRAPVEDAHYMPAGLPCEHNATKRPGGHIRLHIATSDMVTSSMSAWCAGPCMS